MSGDVPATNQRPPGDCPEHEHEGPEACSACEWEELLESRAEWKEEAGRQSRACVALTAALSTAREENARLREALTKIADYACWEHSEDDECDDECALTIARRALNEIARGRTEDTER